MVIFNYSHDIDKVLRNHISMTELEECSFAKMQCFPARKSLDSYYFPKKLGSPLQK